MIGGIESKSVAGVLDNFVGPYSLNAHWTDTHNALELLIPTLDLSDVDVTDFGVNYEKYQLRHIGNLGASIVRSVRRTDSYSYTGTDEDYGYEIKFEPILDETQRSGMPIDYIGYMLDDITYLKRIFGMENGINQGHVEYRQIGSPIALTDIPSEHLTEEEALKYKIMRKMLSVGAHGKELFSATGCSTGIKLGIALANELRESHAQLAFSPVKKERLAKILSNIDPLRHAANFELGRVVGLGILQLKADEKGLEASISTGPNELPYIGYRLLQEDDGQPCLESTGFACDTPANDIDAQVFELLLRHHSGEWFHTIESAKS